MAEIEREEGYSQFPKLNESFESSIPGLYFAGPLSQLRLKLKAILAVGEEPKTSPKHVRLVF